MALRIPNITVQWTAHHGNKLRLEHLAGNRFAIKIRNINPTDVTKLRDGIVLVAGAPGSGKSSTLAVLLDFINREKYYHIITIEDPIEFLHNHKCSTIHQRELHSDTPSFAHALRAAMRQAPKVIMLGEMRDRETMEIVLEAAETGHLVFSSLNTMDAAKTVERMVSCFTPAEQQAVRERFAKSFRYIICQRLVPRADGNGRVPVVEILKANARTRECVEKGEREIAQKLLRQAIAVDIVGSQDQGRVRHI